MSRPPAANITRPQHQPLREANSSDIATDLQSTIGLNAMLKALADPTRLRLISLCSQNDLFVGELVQAVGQSQPRVSRHLKILTDARLLQRYREGAFAVYRLRYGVPAWVRELLYQIDKTQPLFAQDQQTLLQILAERKKQASIFFHRHADKWDILRPPYVSDEQVIRYFQSYLAPRKNYRLIDLGTGTGHMIRALANNAGSVVGVDQSLDMLAIARANLACSSLSHWQIRQGDMMQLDMPNSSQDVAIMHHVLHYLSQPHLAIAEAWRILSDNGTLLVADLAAHQDTTLQKSNAHFWPGFDQDLLRNWFEQAGFVTYRQKKFTHSAKLTISAWILHKRPPR